MELLGPAPGDLANFGERFGAAAFESMRGAEFAGERQSAGKPIDGDDRIAACDPATTPRMESVSSVSAAQGPKVRRLSAGGEWIRTFSSAMRLHRRQRGRGVMPPDPDGE